jgi:hypothetical protein
MMQHQHHQQKHLNNSLHHHLAGAAGATPVTPGGCVGFGGHGRGHGFNKRSLSGGSSVGVGCHSDTTAHDSLLTPVSLAKKRAMRSMQEVGAAEAVLRAQVLVGYTCTVCNFCDGAALRT